MLFYIASSFKSKPMSILYVADDKDKAAYSYDTLMTLLGGDIRCCLLTPSAFREFRNQSAICLRRSEVASTFASMGLSQILLLRIRSRFLRW